MNGRKIWSVLNSKISIVVLGFLLTGVLGAWLSDRFQEASWRRQAEFEAQRRAFEWERQKTFELLRYRLREGIRSLENISDTMNKRQFRMERAFNALSRSNTELTAQAWKEYMEAVDEWNIKLSYYEEDLKRIVGAAFANELNNYETDQFAKLGRCPQQPEDIHSIHGKFYCAHCALNRLRECDDCPERSLIIKTAAELIRALNFQTDEFVSRVGNEFLNRSAELEQFKFHPVPAQGSLNIPVQPTR